MEDVRSYVTAHRDEFLQTLVDYVSQPSISTTGEGVAEAAELAANLMRSAGLTPQIVPTPGQPVVVGHADGGPPGAPHVLIYGHYDVQPPGPLDEWHSPPFSPQVRDGRIYGRGTGDNKAQHLAHLLGLRTLQETRAGLPCPVTVLLDGEEEIGSPHLPWVAENHRDLLAADVVVWSDGPVHETGQASLCLGVRGILRFTLRARGADYPMHSGNWGGVAPNPAWQLVELLSSMRDPDGRVRIEGFYDDVRAFTPEEHQALAELPLDVDHVLASIGASRMDAPADRGYHERLAAWPTLTINSLTCEDAGEHRTVIPNVAVACCDVRLVDSQRVDRITELIRAHVARVAPDVEFATAGSMEPARTPLDSPYLEAVRQGAAIGLGEEPLVLPALGGSLPTYVFTNILGLPTYGVPLANVDEANHSPNENMELRRFYTGITASAAILLQLGASAPSARPVDPADSAATVS